MKLRKSTIRGYHVFYTAFFVGYFFLLYFLLYAPGGLSPFQVNFHFFANAIGSLCKRYMTEASLYALLFYLIYYARKKWLKAVLILLFLLTIFLNAAMALYYSVTRTNIHWYVIKGIQWNLILSFLHGKLLLITLVVLGVMLGMSVFLYYIKPNTRISLAKHLAVLSVFAGLFLGGTFSPMGLDYNISIFKTDQLQKKQASIFDLEKSGLENLAHAFRAEYFPPQPLKEALTTEETEYLESLGLMDKQTIASDFHPKKIVLVVFENVNQSFLSYYNNQIPGATPFLDSLFSQYPHLDAFYPSGTYTLYGLSSLLCSHLNSARMQTDSNYECLPNLLRKAGYSTEFIRGFSKYYVHENVFLDKIGFDVITAKEDFDQEFPDFKAQRPELYDGWGYSDNYVFDKAIQRLKEKPDKKQFLTLLTVDTHSNGGRCYRPRTANDPQNDELFSVTCLDSALKDFFAKLESEGQFNDDLLVILTSDHLYASYSDIPGDQSWDSFSAIPGRLPLLFISKKPISMLASLGSQIDLAPTLLDILDLEAPNGFMGRSLMAYGKSIPMGQDGNLIYAIVGNEFFGFDLQIQNLTRPEGPSGKFLELYTGKLEELEKEIDQMRRERDRSWDTDTALFKWITNQLY